ncbi:MAG: DNA mismatch repair protein MutS, partial [Flavobacteriaceae bacterium]
MINISKKTLQDLEFESVIMQVASHNVTSLGKTAILETIPFSKRADVVEALLLTNEFVASFENENRIPNHGFDSITKELKLIKIEDNYLEIDGFRKIVSI